MAPDLGLNEDFRVEHDSMGEVRVPTDALWGAQTQRAVENFPISGRPLEPALIHALARIKAAAAQTNLDLGTLTDEQARAITAAATEVADGGHDDQFPIDVFQTGSGTSTNMNVNEVIAALARRAGVEVHPNDHVNAAQSSNDTFPSAIHVAATLGAQDLLDGIATLHAALAAASTKFADAVKSGRTHLMDATPVTFGQELGGYAAVVDRARERLESVLPRVRELPLGGTAVGTGINAPAGFAERTIAAAQRRDRPAVHRGPRPLRGAGRPGRHRRAQRRAAHLRRRAGQDLQRPALDGQRPHGRARRDPPARPPARVEHHARQGQPGDPRGHLDGLRPGDRQRRRDRLRRRVGQLRAQRDAAGHRPQRAGVRTPPRQRQPAAGRDASAASPSTGTGCAVTPSRRRRWSRRSTSTSATRPPPRIAKRALADGATIRETVLSLGYVERGEITEAQLDEALDIERMTARQGQT